MTRIPVPRTALALLLSSALAGCLCTTARASTSQSDRIAKLEREVDHLQTTVGVIEILVFALLGGGFIVGLVTTFRVDRRNTEIHHLSFAGESASQDRAEQVHTTFLDASQHTLSLVNETLQLAKDASQRAEEALADRAQRAQDQIEGRARALVRPLVMRSDLHTIVTSRETRRDFVDVAGDISLVQGYLEMAEIRLSAACHFVLGINAHFQGDSLRAIKHLELASSERRPGDEDIEIAALFWCAYEQNNIGEHQVAEGLFNKAVQRETPGAVRHYELQRMLHETRFFVIAASHQRTHERHALEDVAGLLTDLDKIRGEMPTRSELKQARGHLEQIEAHLLVWAANLPKFATKVDGGVRENLKRALKLFQQANDDEKNSPELWTILGEAETNYHLTGDVDGAKYKKAIDLARDGVDTRVEHRSIISFHQARLIAQARLKKPLTEGERTYDRVRDELKRLEPHMYVFSHFTKCNLSHDDFKAELEEFWEAYEARSADA